MPLLTPWQVYQNALASGSYESDPAQANAMQQLEALYQQLQINQRQRLLPKFLKRQFAKQGVYLYGEVGAGKTWMMDMFYQCVTEKKLRFHFHQFMREIHQELKILQGQKNPLQIIAKHLAKRAKVICFDELFVNDITDAMLLGELFKFLFEQGICFVMTSNVTPDLLYRNGLQRSRFQPAITLLQQQLELVQVKSLKDYRWRNALSEGVYFHPLNAATAQDVQNLFTHLTLNDVVSNEAVEENQRQIDCIAHASDVLWCRFEQLCHSPRSVQDYVSLSKKFKVFILDETPIIPAEDENSIWYLISLIDVLYDARCRLVLRAQAAPKELYLGDKLKFEYQRTLSRLQEMQTQDYWL